VAQRRRVVRRHPEELGRRQRTARVKGRSRCSSRAISLQCAVGYERNAVKIFCDKNGNVTKVPYVEHPPYVTACIFWLKNRDPARWRDAWQLDHTLGKYIISDRQMTEEEWFRERAA
jgi:hypothetical protein